jgi:hypothetical protein
MRMAETGAWRTCFFEDDPNCSLLRRAAVEGIGTYLLMLAAAASCLQAQHLFPTLPGIALVASAVTIVIRFTFQIRSSNPTNAPFRSEP